MSDATKYPPREYVLVKSVSPKFLWANSRVQGTGEYFLPYSVPCLNCGGGDRWCHHQSSLSGNLVELIRTVTCMALKTKANGRLQRIPTRAVLIEKSEG
ncbi:hypothetical protein TNCV_4270891 [Trichonephila clavipes]|nr:hypothetical protein TNCV_4270891 [Trichonephila clavipes]